MKEQAVIQTVAEATLRTVTARQDFGDGAVMLNAKNIVRSAGLGNASPALRERMMAFAAVLLAAVMITDEAIAAEYGPEEDVATNG